MTWTKLGDEFSDQLAGLGLTDAAYRTHVEALQWLFRTERTDCTIPRGLVGRFAGSPDAMRGIRELVSFGLWSEDDRQYVVVHHGDILRQSLAAQLAKRETERERQRRKRARPDVTPDVGTNVTPNTDRQSDSTEKGNSQKAEDWPEVTPVGRWIGAEARARKTA